MKVEDRMLRAAIEHYKRLACVTEGAKGVMWTLNTDPAFWSAVETSFRSPGARLSPRGRSISVMKADVHVKKDGKWYVATDLVTHIADQGRTRGAAIRNLTKGLREHYEVLVDLAPRKRGTKAPSTRRDATPSRRGRSRSR